jgi:imidazolonepropionase-like amidohydrolase
MLRSRLFLLLTITLVLAASLPPALTALSQELPPQITPAPNRRADEGQGPFKTLVIRGAWLIDGTGAPPQGPVDIVIEQNRIKAVRSAGTPGLPLKPEREPKQADHEIDATGMYVLPGFVDNHVHAGGAPKNAEAEYPYKLWLAHGVTTVRGVPLTANNISVKEKERSARNEIVAPRIFNYQRPGVGWDKGPVNTPEAAREWVRWAAANGIDGLKLGAHRPEIMAALLDEAKKLGLGSTAHLQQTGVAQMNALKAAQLGLGTVTHFYGHFEALLKDYVVQPWPMDQINNDEQMRFGQPGMERVSKGPSETGHGLRSDDDGLCGQPRCDEDAQRRLARQIHAALVDGFLSAEPQQSRFVLVLLDDTR